eukprot:TRINITY_DN77901_c0_g1_i1.p1 TRINITY_DN77901_c0_g1~~TRINITY_DN77901_c0_g1_i1.p1  ORF type:complete len:231 (-),score=43.03 TRINITY_DN77901_c0_g1_i1:118-810(-)
MYRKLGTAAAADTDSSSARFVSSSSSMTTTHASTSTTRHEASSSSTTTSVHHRFNVSEPFEIKSTLYNSFPQIAPVSSPNFHVREDSGHHERDNVQYDSIPSHSQIPTLGYMISPPKVYTTVTTQRYLKYALRTFDEHKAYYDVVSIRTEITTDIKYVTCIEQNPPEVTTAEDNLASAAHFNYLAEAGPSLHGSLSEDHSAEMDFSCDGQTVPYSLCLPIHPDVGDDDVG